MKGVWVSIICAMMVLGSINAEGKSIPSWRKAERVMQKCYGGWDVKISLDAGVGVESTVGIASSSDAVLSDGYYNSYDNQEGKSSTTSDGEGSGSSAYDQYSVSENLSQNIEGSINDQEFYNSGASAFVGIKMTVPLYDRKTRLSRKEKTNAEIGRLADLYAKFEGHRATVIALEMETKVSKRVMMDGGQGAISAYFSLLTQKEKSKALAKSAERQIKTILKGCGYVERSRTAGKGHPSK